MTEPTIPTAQQESTGETRGKGNRVAQPLPNIPRQRQASVPDEVSSMPSAALADLIDADQPHTDADLRGIQELIVRHLKSRETVMIENGCEQQQDGDPGPAVHSLVPPPVTTTRASVCS